MEFESKRATPPEYGVSALLETDVSKRNDGETAMDVCDVAVIGAGPHGLSLAAHLAARGIDFRVFGKPLSTWADHMPGNMVLKSDGFVSNLSAPSPDSTLKAYCSRNGLPYADEGLPVPLDTFLSYATTFRKRFVPTLEETNVVSLKADGDRFASDAGNWRAAAGAQCRAGDRHHLTSPMCRRCSRNLGRIIYRTALRIATAMVLRARKWRLSAAVPRPWTLPGCCTGRAHRCASSRARLKSNLTRCRTPMKKA